LGLTVAKGIIEAHGGQIEVESQPGQGSQFTVKLPIPQFAAKEGQPDQSSSKLRRILIVDDEENVTLMLQEGLEQLPACEIMTATGGEQALQLFEQQPFDLVITDYNMPEVDGLTLATHIRRSYPQTSIVMLTGYANDRLRKQAAEVSIQRVLDKPIKLKEICRVASETLNET
jgi:CheY-like chemotaxis protein